MRVTKVYVRFFRSFNYDYERKAVEEAVRHPWEMIDQVWYPFVRVPLEPSVTAVVGANESGKSHLISAIKQARTGERIDRGEFCRYSDLYEVETGTRRDPDFGVEIELQAEEDEKAFPGDASRIGIGSTATLLRLGDGRNLLVTADGEERKLSKAALGKIEARLPKPFELKTNVPLPDSISFDALLERGRQPLDDRKRRFQFVEFFRALGKTDGESLSGSSEEITKFLALSESQDARVREKEAESASLACRLLREVANIDTTAFEDLEEELREGSEGKVGGLITKMNRALARHLNFNRWWTQDRDFRLELEPRERELVFVITDRTGTKYSFAERSRGLSYFLSYFVQLQAHQQARGRQDASRCPEILLMDEPDAYLSSVGQQDLLKALEDFSVPASGRRGDQVVYVTHSPFLINRNASHRIRVLDKGSDQEGTRVVKDVSRNHYEPLRSSVGVYVAETAFIGGSNLLVEGLSDQVLLTSITSLLRYRQVARTKLLDLNVTTIIPAGGADGVPYMAYLARGRDELKPACIAMLDGDEAGENAAERIAGGDSLKRKAIIAAKYVLNVGAWAKEANARLEIPESGNVVEPEDLIPPSIVIESARAYAIAILRCSQEEAERLTVDSLLTELGGDSGGRMWKALESEFARVFDGGHIEKAGFAKEVGVYIDGHRDDRSKPAGMAALETNFGELIEKLAGLLSAAESTELAQRTNKRSDRIARAFLGDYPDSVTRDTAYGLLYAIESSLENTAGDDAVRSALGDMRRRFDLAKDPLESVPDFPEFRQKLMDLPAIRRQAYRPASTASLADRASTTD
jgi:predicted ATP-dependent endonuclease of OLD family